MLAENLSKILAKEIQKKHTEILKKTKENSKHARKEKENIDASYFVLEKAKLKYEKSFHDWKEADRNYQIADQDGTMSRNEISKMRIFSETKCKTYEQYRIQYSDQLLRTNSDQKKYFGTNLVNILNSLQEIDKERLQFVKAAMKKALVAEKDAVKISNKCRESIDEAFDNICEENDQNRVTERIKTGETPPSDIEFEEIQLTRQKKASSLTRRLSRASFGQKSGKQNLFQTKRKILKNIEKNKSEISKGEKIIRISNQNLFYCRYKRNGSFATDDFNLYRDS